MTTKYNWQKSTEVHWTSMELYGSESLFDNNVGGCEYHFYGICLFETEQQKVPCIFCRYHNK